MHARQKWTGTRQRDDLLPCPFCGTASVQQVRLADSVTEMQYRIGCGNPFCAVEPNTPAHPDLRNAELAWQGRDCPTAEEEVGQTRPSTISDPQ